MDGGRVNVWMGGGEMYGWEGYECMGGRTVKYGLEEGECMDGRRVNVWMGGG